MSAADTPKDEQSTAEQLSRDIPLPDHLKDALARDWEPAPPMPHPARADGAPYNAKRRCMLSERFPGKTLIVPAGNLRVRANDTDYYFRASSVFTWLTGETVADAVLVMTPSGAWHTSTLYVREYAAAGQIEYFTSRTSGAIWVGNVPSLGDTAEVLNVSVRPLLALEGDLAPYRAAAGDDLLLLRGFDSSIDALFPAASPGELLQTIDELRLTKDEWEVDRLRYACEVTARGFADTVRELPLVLDRPLRGERWLEGTFWRRARLEGNDVGYGSIVGAGTHGTTLHWWRNHGRIVSGDLLLADMGVETDELYTADVTRTMPVTGEWTADQRRIYAAVLEAQDAGIAEVRAGNDFLAAHRAAMFVLADYLHSWGVLPVAAAVSCDPETDKPGAGLHRRYTLHGTSHMLGIDVHDCAAAREQTYRNGSLESGHVLTVEPGLYFQPNDLSVPPSLRGLAVRIEDDILVTDGEAINLSSALPRDPDELTGWMREVQHTPLSL